WSKGRQEGGDATLRPTASARWDCPRGLPQAGETERPMRSGVEPLVRTVRLLATSGFGGLRWCRGRPVWRRKHRLSEARVDKLAGSPCPWFVSPLAGKTTDWRAGCGRSASPVRREGEAGQPSLPTPITTLLSPARKSWVAG